MKTYSRSRAQAIIPFLIATALTAASVAALAPALNLWRGASPKDKSLNNVRVLAGAIRAYALDYDGSLPGWVNNRPRGIGQYAHNTWDQQIRPYVSSDRYYTDGGTGIRSYSQPRYHNRVLTYGLNGLLITPPVAPFTGNADFSAANNNPPSPHSLQFIAAPETTILLAELSTRMPMNAPYGRQPFPLPFTWSGSRSSTEWQRALDGWIDVSPRAFVETGNPGNIHNYSAPYQAGVVDHGIARDLYDGGGCYAFCDGHVELLKIIDSVGIGKLVGTAAIPVHHCWASANPYNMWNPRFPREK